MIGSLCSRTNRMNRNCYYGNYKCEPPAPFSCWLELNFGFIICLNWAWYRCGTATCTVASENVFATDVGSSSPNSGSVNPTPPAASFSTQNNNCGGCDVRCRSNAQVRIPQKLPNWRFQTTNSIHSLSPRSLEKCTNGQCITLDPCANVNCGSNSACSNGECTCNSGFVSSTGDGRNCYKPDPCADVNCGTNSNCNGGTCSCNSGFVSSTGDGRNCYRPDPCQNVNCGSNSQCSNGVCACNSGFVSDTNDGRNCYKPDPCANVRCGSNSKCADGVCSCNPGFVSDSDDGKNCHRGCLVC